MEIEKYEYWGKSFTDQERQAIMMFLELAEKFKQAMLNGGLVKMDIETQLDNGDFTGRYFESSPIERPRIGIIEQWTIKMKF